MRGIGAGSGLAAAVAASGLLLVGLPSVYLLTAYGCGEGEDRPAEALADETVLGTAPDGADRASRYQECDDDRFVVVGTRYRYGGSPKTAVRHYREAAQADSWRPRTTDGGETVPGCFTKSVDGTTAYLGVESPEKDVLHVEIVADRAESEWC
ncbi:MULTISPECIES: hypothetical protein [unclassified Streptomyces]|uniref:hypothetical protein n=1 Tax=unclassified Streptomyces TaxID=2593676 RepID=UPI00073B244D|nr:MULTISPECIES: hypothetical protein [unclassified Streptomyces]ODA69872.1 hypothetical protein APS67_005991 [Streptomyces sp. AVP053U2]